jgi:hypothetical protein
VEAIVLGLFIYELDIPRLATGKVLPGYVRAHAAVVAGLIPILLRSGLLTWVVAFGILLLVGTAVFSAVLRRLDL